MPPPVDPHLGSAGPHLGPARPPLGPARPPLGAHVSVAGGLPLAFERAAAIHCEALQIFVKNANQWQGRELRDEEVAAFRRARATLASPPVFAHASYLINISATDRATLRHSVDGLLDELDRCHRLGLDGLVLHPGAHMGRGIAPGLERAAGTLRQVLDRSPGSDPPILLENTAGQGTYLGASLEQIGELQDKVSAGDRLGVCIDTCHAFAAGYDLRTLAGLELLVSKLAPLGGAACLHLNDSEGALGSHRDRHRNIGAGTIGSRAFGRLIRHRALRCVPMIVETPLGTKGDGHAQDLAKLRRMRARSRWSHD